MNFRVALFIVLLTAPALALEPQNLLLIVNRNVPEGRELAEYYAKKRGVPDGHILELNLPAGDDIAFQSYETDVVPAIHDFIGANRLHSKVACLVTFYGVPLRISARVAAPADALESRTLAEELKQQMELIVPQVEAMEKMAKAAQPAFLSLIRGKNCEAMQSRADFAARFLSRHIAQMEDPPGREALVKELSQRVNALIGSGGVASQQLAQIQSMPNPSDRDRARAEELAREIQTRQVEAAQLQLKRSDPAARAKLRQLYKEKFGPLDYGRLLEGMIEYLKTADTDSALDSELPLVAWGYYGRANWVTNPLHHRVARGSMAPTLMAMRIDGPTPVAVRALIDASVNTQAKGLEGKVVIDSGGHLAIDAKNPTYAAYDNSLKRLAELIRTKTRLELVFDDKREVLPPQSAKDVAIYTGWYAVRRYTPSCTFVPGAVGYHTASFEMCSLHNPGETGWCRGLLVDGAAATVGSVAEPFLHAFPPPDEFFPLLLTGKMTLAEAYWRTCPTVSWRMAVVGDPLYNPYAAHPAIAVEDLPDAVKRIFGPTTRPATRPAGQ